MMSLMKTCLTNWRSQFGTLSSRCPEVINNQISNVVSAAHTRNLHLPSSVQAMKFREMGGSIGGYPRVISVRGFHLLQGFPEHVPSSLDAPSMHPPRNLLDVTSPGIMQHVRTFKSKNKLKKRCKDCYITCITGRMMMLCKTHPRHKQILIQPPKKTTWILTHATQGRIRPW